MARQTIAQIRENQAEALIRYHYLAAGMSRAEIDVAAQNAPDDIRHKAYNLIRRYYYLCALSYHNLLLANDEKWCNSKHTTASEAREDKLYKALKSDFEAFSGLSLIYCSYYPSIGTKEQGGGVSVAIHAAFYD